MTITISFEELSLDDEPAIREFVERLKIKPRYNELNFIDERAEVAARWAAKPFWERYFYAGRSGVGTDRFWRDRTAIWIQLQKAEGKIVSITIKGLKSEEAEWALYREVCVFEDDVKRTPNPDELTILANKLLNPTSYPHQHLFKIALEQIHTYFSWQGQEIIEEHHTYSETEKMLPTGQVEPTAAQIPISKIGLPDADVELLREVFKRLPPFRDFNFDGGNYAKRAEAAKHVKRSRQKFEKLIDVQHSLSVRRGNLAEHEFQIWADQCLQFSSKQWLRSKELHGRYIEWTQRGGYGKNSGERREAKMVALSIKKWGQLMRRQFDGRWRRDKHGILYNVTFKRGA
jgi:hypothetical protein